MKIVWFRVPRRKRKKFLRHGRTDRPRERKTVRSLADLVPGESAAVTAFAAAEITEPTADTDRVILRLLDLGFVPGTRVTVLGAAPGGDPMLVRLRGYDLSLRRADAGKIPAERIPDESAVTAEP